MIIIFLCLTVPPTRRDVLLMIVHYAAWFSETNIAQSTPAQRECSRTSLHPGRELSEPVGVCTFKMNFINLREHSYKANPLLFAFLI